jgi:hypothetical protein
MPSVSKEQLIVSCRVYMYNPSTQEMRQEDLRFKARLGCIVKPCLKKESTEAQR